MSLVHAIAVGDQIIVAQSLSAFPGLASARIESGATRQAAKENFLDEIKHYVYSGDTALHVAAAGHHPEIVQRLIAMGADVGAKNRRGAAPLHYAVDGIPGSPRWDPSAQAATVACLIAAGADPNAVDLGGVTPLHRAVRNRCAAAVKELLDGGADPVRKNKSGSTAWHLAAINTGRGGTGLPEAKAQQAEIVRLLRQYGGAVA